MCRSIRTTPRCSRCSLPPLPSGDVPRLLERRGTRRPSHRGQLSVPDQMSRAITRAGRHDGGPADAVAEPGRARRARGQRRAVHHRPPGDVRDGAPAPGALEPARRRHPPPGRRERARPARADHDRRRPRRRARRRPVGSRPHALRAHLDRPRDRARHPARDGRPGRSRGTHGDDRPRARGRALHEPGRSRGRSGRRLARGRGRLGARVGGCGVDRRPLLPGAAAAAARPRTGGRVPARARALVLDPRGMEPGPRGRQRSLQRLGRGIVAARAVDHRVRSDPRHEGGARARRRRRRRDESLPRSCPRSRPLRPLPPWRASRAPWRTRRRWGSPCSAARRCSPSRRHRITGHTTPRRRALRPASGASPRR